MSNIDSTSALAELFINNTPLLDVRAPVEFTHGAFPAACNLPLLNDAERAAVGTEYKNVGRDAAIALGEQLVSGDIKERRIAAWCKFIADNPGAQLYCYRGGLRSQIAQQWISDSGTPIERIEGGYKFMRRFLIDTLEAVSGKEQFIIVAGKTGTGKTHLLNQLEHSVDLEGYASHRGSAFGRRINAQPSQIDFENQLAIRFLKLPYHSSKKIFLEDESHAIGSLSIPQNLYTTMRQSPVAIVDVDSESRIDTILNDYIRSNFDDFNNRDPETAFDLFSEFLLGSLSRIKRRLGNENFDAVNALMEGALQAQRQHNELSGHREWIGKLLLDYYDPMYEYQLSKKSRHIVFRGNDREFLQWAASINANRE